MSLSPQEARNLLQEAATKGVGELHTAMVRVCQDFGYDIPFEVLPTFPLETWLWAREVATARREHSEAVDRCLALEKQIGKSFELSWRAGYAEAIRRAAQGESLDEDTAWEDVNHRLVAKWAQLTNLVEEPE